MPSNLKSREPAQGPKRLLINMSDRIGYRSKLRSQVDNRLTYFRA